MDADNALACGLSISSDYSPDPVLNRPPKHIIYSLINNDWPRDGLATNRIGYIVLVIVNPFISVTKSTNSVCDLYT